MCSDQWLSVCNVQTAASCRAQAARAKTAAPRRQVPSRWRQEPLSPGSRKVVVARWRSNYADYNTLKLARMTSDHDNDGQLKRESSFPRTRNR